MTSFIAHVTFDVVDPPAMATFWSQVLDYDVALSEPDLSVITRKDPRGVKQLMFFRVDDPTPGKNRMHVDLGTREPLVEIERLVGLGAALVDGRDDDGAAIWRDGLGASWVVLADPEGNQFCIG